MWQVSFDDAFKNAALFKKAKKEKLLAKRAAGGMIMPVELQEVSVPWGHSRNHNAPHRARAAWLRKICYLTE